MLNIFPEYILLLNNNSYMLVIDSTEVVSLVFDDGYSGLVSGLTMVIEDKITNTSVTKTFDSILLTNERFTELEISWADTLVSGQYYYYLKLNTTETLDEGILKVVLPITALPIYKDNMDEYVVYKN